MDGRIEGETRRRNKQEQERKRHIWRTKVWQQSKTKHWEGKGRWKQHWGKQHGEQNTKQRKEEQTNQSHINLETDRANRLEQRSNAHARNKRSKVENSYKIQPSLFLSPKLQENSALAHISLHVWIRCRSFLFFFLQATTLVSSAAKVSSASAFGFFIVVVDVVGGVTDFVAGVSILCTFACSDFFLLRDQCHLPQLRLFVLNR